jgi:hypothetical protein
VQLRAAAGFAGGVPRGRRAGGRTAAVAAAALLGGQIDARGRRRFHHALRRGDRLGRDHGLDNGRRTGGVPAPSRAGLTRKGGSGSATAEPAASASIGKQ